MPRYYFHLRHGQKALMDCEGFVLADATAAREQGIRTVDDFFWPLLGTVDPDWADCRLDVRDERGRRILDIGFADGARVETESPAPLAQSSRATRVVYLDIERARREFAAVEDRGRALLQRTRNLFDLHSNAALHLSQQLTLLQELRSSSAELVARSRRQSCASLGASRAAVVA